MSNVSPAEARTRVPLERSLRATLEISQALNLSLSLGEMLQLLARKVHSLIGFDCSVVLVDPETLDLTWAGYYGLSEEYVRAMNEGHNHLRSPEMLQGTIGRAFVSRRPESTTDLDDARVRPWRDDARREGICTVVSTPMILHDRVLGFITCYTRQPHLYSAAEQDLLAIIANQAAIAVDAARLHDHERQRAAELLRLNARLAEQHQLLEQQHALLIQAERIHDQLTSVLLQNSGLEAVVAQIGELIGRPVVLYDGDLKQIAARRSLELADELERTCTEARRLPREVFVSAGANRLIEQLRDEGRSVRFQSNDLAGATFSRYIAPVSTGRSMLGYLEIVESPGPIDGLALRAVEHGTTVLALELLKQRAVLQAEQQLRGSFLDALLAGEFESDEAIARRAGFVGFDLSLPYRVLALGLDPASSDDRRSTALPVDGLRQRLERLVANCCKVRFPGVAVTLKGDVVAILWPVTGGTRGGVLEVAATIRGEVEAALRGLTVSVGIGSTCRRPAEFPNAFAEARYCLELLHRFGNSGRALAIDAVGLRRFLLNSRQDEQLLTFAHQTLDRLVAQEERQGTPLLHTLTTFLRLGCSLTRTAEALVMHVNTVQYRIRRVEQLTGSLLSTPEGLMELQLALMIASLSPREFPSLLTEPVSGLAAELGYPGPDEDDSSVDGFPDELGALTRRSRARAPR